MRPQRFTGRLHLFPSSQTPRRDFIITLRPIALRSVRYHETVDHGTRRFFSTISWTNGVSMCDEIRPPICHWIEVGWAPADWRAPPVQIPLEWPAHHISNLMSDRPCLRKKKSTGDMCRPRNCNRTGPPETRSTRWATKWSSKIVPFLLEENAVICFPFSTIFNSINET